MPCIADDNRWYDSTPFDKGTVFELCQECYDVELRFPRTTRFSPRVATSCASGWRRLSKRRGTSSRRCSQFLIPAGVPVLCQGNHQFDSLRRAKHTTMMVLYHPNNPSEPAFVATCNVCQRELEPGKVAKVDVLGLRHLRECKISRATSTLVRSGQSTAVRLAGTRRRTGATARRNSAHDGALVDATTCKLANRGSPNCTKVAPVQTRDVVHDEGWRRVPAVPQDVDAAASAQQGVATNCPVPRSRDLKEYRRRATEQIESAGASSTACTSTSRTS